MGLSGFRGRIVSLAVLTATLVVAVFVVLSHVLLTRSTDADTRTLARTRVEAVAGTVQVHDGKVQLVEGTGDAFDTVAWVFEDGRLIDGAAHPADAVSRLATVGRDQFMIADRYLLYAEPLPVQAHRVTIVVTVDLTPYEHSEQRNLMMSLALGALAVALAGFIAYLGVNRSLRVVHRMSALADEWGDHDPDRRFALASHDEFGELARTFDRLLDRVSNTIADERRLTDEIAHELRTPIAVLRGEAQLAELSCLLVEPQVVLTEADRLDTAVSTILDAARSRLRSAETCGLEVALRQVTQRHGLPIGSPPEVDLAIPLDVVASVLTPLLDNAVRHARTAASLQVETNGDCVLVHVLDDGPGFRPDDLERVFEAGHSSSDGHGLGLAVVRRIANATGLGVRAIADGQGHVEVRFPLA
ncbi:HAMP domain-containing sensor histidine kinase [Kribbella koreensis]|uniref:histidine kinase n=1 Tax=Kribbella koreensis TaxID=57909 RepID=A0ABN1QTV7_9ACTN